jgi:2-iminobutanoate/2-iminopropanoate deaminase
MKSTYPSRTAQKGLIGMLTMVCLLSLTACQSGRGLIHHKDEKALGPYSGSVISGDTCFVSGKIGSRRDSVEEETNTAIDALEAELARAELTLADVVSVTVYMTDIVYYSYVNAVYARRFRDPFPARACVAVKALPGKARVEIQAIARRP